MEEMKIKGQSFKLGKSTDLIFETFYNEATVSKH